MGLTLTKLIMNKEELLQELSAKITTGEIGREEILHRFEHVPPKESSPFPVTRMLYVLGAAILVIGIITFVSQIWDDIGSLGRIAVTLGLGLLITALGSWLLKTKPAQNLGAIFHFIGGMLIPGGALVTLDELSTGVDRPWVLAITFGGIFAFYLLLNFVHKNAILTFFAIAHGTATVYLIVNAITDTTFNDWLGIQDIYEYLTMAVGASYLLLAHAFRDGWNKNLIGALMFFGITAFLGATFAQVFDSVPWQILYFFVVMGCLLLAVFMKSHSILVMSTVFLLAHVSYITSEYFADSLGWPISLVILGFLFIGLGYASININKNYIAR